MLIEKSASKFVACRGQTAASRGSTCLLRPLLPEAQVVLRVETLNPDCSSESWAPGPLSDLATSDSLGWGLGARIFTCSGRLHCAARIGKRQPMGPVHASDGGKVIGPIIGSTVGPRRDPKTQVQSQSLHDPETVHTDTGSAASF